MSELPTQVVDVVLKTLADRSGFDHWWDDLDSTIRLDVVADLEDAVGAVMQGEGYNA